jgi:predicted nuclease with TOPRIM domain
MAIPRKPIKDMSLDDVRALVHSVREEGLRIQRHYKKLEEEYSDWEDRVWKLDKILLEMEEKTGLSKQEIEKDTDNEYIPDELFSEPKEDNSVEVDWGDLN